MAQRALKMSKGLVLTVIPLLIRDITAYVPRFWALTHLTWYAHCLGTTSRWSLITQYIVLYPNFLAVEGVTRDMCVCIVRRNYNGAYFHVLGWTSPHRIIIHRHFRTKLCSIYSICLGNFYNAFLFDTFF